MAKTDVPPDASPKLAAPERVAAFRTGLSAETRAAAFLMAKGYRILAKRFKTPYGEIDIVAKKRDLIAFIEVKARARLDDAAYCSCRSGPHWPRSLLTTRPPTRLRTRHRAQRHCWLRPKRSYHPT